LNIIFRPAGLGLADNWILWLMEGEINIIFGEDSHECMLALFISCGSHLKEGIPGFCQETGNESIVNAPREID